MVLAENPWPAVKQGTRLPACTMVALVSIEKQVRSVASTSMSSMSLGALSTRLGLAGSKIPLRCA